MAGMGEARSIPRCIFDLAIVGLGAVGSAALYAAARRGVRTIGIDRFSPPHRMGSSHGETRITRQAIGEGLKYVPLVLRSNEILNEVEKQTGARLLERCGFIFITREDHATSHHGKTDFLAATQKAALDYGIEHSIFDHADLQSFFPQFTGLVGDECAYYEPGGGYVRPELCVQSFLELAETHNAIILPNTRVSSYRQDGDGYVIETDNGNVLASKILLATGAWLPQLAPKVIGRNVTVYGQTLHWYRVGDMAAYRPSATPTFIWTHGLENGAQFYGFPPIDGQIKVAAEQYCFPLDPDDATGSSEQGAAAWMTERHVRGRLAGVSTLPVKSERCFYTATDDCDFLIDKEDQGVLAVSACSGHGFKHAPAVGESATSILLEERAHVDLTSFSARRFATR